MTKNKTSDYKKSNASHSNASHTNISTSHSISSKSSTNNNSCHKCVQCEQPCIYSQSTSYLDALDTIKIPGSGLLSVYNNPDSTGVTGPLAYYGSDNLEVLNPTGNVIYGDVFINLESSNDLIPYKSVNYINGELIIFNVSSNVLQLSDIFPCLIGINGNFYMSTYQISKITGFYKLKYILGELFISGFVPELQSPQQSNSRLKSKHLEKIKKMYSKLNLNPPIITDSSETIDASVIPCFSALETVGYPELFTIPLPIENRIDIGSIDNYGIVIESTNYLLQINGFDSLKYTNFIVIERNSALQKICGFESLVSTDFIDILFNDNLNLIKGFNSLTVTTDFLSVSSNQSDGTQIFVMDAFPSLEICGDLFITSNYNLKSFSLPNLQIANDVTIADDYGLEYFDLCQLNLCDNFIIAANDSLRKFNVCQLSSIGGYLHIVQNSSLIYLHNFDSLCMVGMAIVIAANGFLEKISDFKKLEIIGSVQEINTIYPAPNNSDDDGVQTSWFNLQTLISVLPNYISSPNLSLVSLPNSVFIYSNTLLKDISGFNSLCSIPDSIYIMSNTQLERLNAFNNATFALDFILINNHALKAMKIFEELLYIRYLIITDTMCVIKICGLTKLCQADVIYIDILAPELLPNLQTPLPTVEGVYSYYALETTCSPYSPCKQSGLCGQCQC
jgi:hypothetical protein